MENVWIFFYGTFMSARVLQQFGINCSTTYPAKLDGYSLYIRPRVNLTRNSEACSYGGLALISQKDIDALYADLKKNFNIEYLPYPITVQLSDKSTQSALCYICSEISDEAPDPDYINEMERCAKEMGAPESYISHIKSFSVIDNSK